jgi:hypothetical protein
MTTPTADQATEILASVGDFAGGFLAANLDYVWAKYDLIGGRLQLLYTKRDLVDMAMGEVRKRVDFQTPSDVSVMASQLLNNLLKMRNALSADITKLENTPGGVVEDGSTFAAFAGELLTTGSTALPGFSGEPDVNSLTYRGSPYPSNRTRRLP